MSAKIEKKQLTVNQLIEDLANGLTWLKKDDIGSGSIQEKYGANEFQVKTIQKHPKLIGLEPSLTVFEIIDDTINEETSSNTTNNAVKSAVQTEKAPVVTKQVQNETKPATNPSNGTVSSEDAFDGL